MSEIVLIAALVFAPILAGVLVVVRQDAARARRDTRWLDRHR